MESTYRLLREPRPWSRTYHQSQRAKDGYCTVTGARPWHRAKWSILVKSTNDGHECDLASCDEHLPPTEDGGPGQSRAAP